MAARADAYGGLTLTEVGTVGTAAGKVGNAAYFSSPSSANYLQHTAAEALFHAGQSFTCFSWTKMDSANGAAIGRIPFSIITTNFLMNLEFRWLPSGGLHKMRLSFNAGGGAKTFASSTSIDYTDGLYHFGAFWWDYSLQTMYLETDFNGTINSIAGGSVGGFNPTSAATFRVGLSTNGVTGPWHGGIDEVAFFPGVLSYNQRWYAWNNGAGQSYD